MKQGAKKIKKGGKEDRKGVLMVYKIGKGEKKKRKRAIGEKNRSYRQERR